MLLVVIMVPVSWKRLHSNTCSNIAHQNHQKEDPKDEIVILCMCLSRHGYVRDLVTEYTQRQMF